MNEIKARLYKSNEGKWTVDLTLGEALLPVMPNQYQMEDGTIVSRWEYPTWEDAMQDLIQLNKFEPTRDIEMSEVA